MRKPAKMKTNFEVVKYVFKFLFLSIPISFGIMFLSINHPAITQVIIDTIGNNT